MQFLTNATITYNSPSSPVVIGENPVTGEPIFGSSSGDLVTIECSLEEAEEKGNTYPIEGVDIHGTFLRGRATNPLTIPSSFKAGLMANLTWSDGTNSRTGRFYVIPVVSSRFGLESYFGAAIAGFLIEG